MLSRRTLLQSAIAGAAFAGSAARAADGQRGLAAAAHGVNPVLVARALDALARHNEVIWSRDVIGIADFGLPSSQRRFHVVDLLAGTTTSLYVTHGQGSDPRHTGMLQFFADTPDSLCTSEGTYLMGDEYVGKHGLSRRMLGIDPSNAHVYVRDIVIHSAAYADAALIASQGKLGRSDGCFAFSETDIGFVLARLGRGRMVYAGRA
jgi:hypothetical protein